jgi:hypothetical protein
MAFQVDIKQISQLRAGADLSAAGNQFKLVKLNTSSAVVVTAGATEVSIGVLQNKPKSGEEAVVALLTGGGISKMRAGGTIAKGDLLKSDTDGEVLASTPTANDFIVGQAVEAAAAGQVFCAVLFAYRHAVS